MAGTENEEVSLWGSGTYRLWFAADTSDVFAVGLRTFVVPLLALQLSGSPFVAGLIVAIESTLGLVLLPIGGTLADRWDRRRMMIALGLLGFVLSVAAFALLAGDAMTTWLFAALIALFAIVNGLLGGSNDAILKSIVPMERFATAQAIREGREACVELSGGAIAGFLYKLTHWCPFLASAVLYLVSAVTSVSLPRRTGRPVPDDIDNDDDDSRDATTPGFLTQLREGVVWISTKRTFLALMAKGALVNISCVSFILGAQLMLAERGTDPVLIGVVSTVSGLGALVGSLAAGWLVERIPAGVIILAVNLMFVVSLCMVLVSDSYPMILAAQIPPAFGFPALNAASLGFLYGKTPQNMQGRASAVYETSVGLFAAVTPVLVGWLLRGRFGFDGVLWFALLCLIAAIVLILVSPIRRIPVPSRWAELSL